MRAPAALLLAAFALAGCAKFPDNGARDFTRIRFVITYSGPINPEYLYYVAVRRIIGNDTTGSTYGPIPVFGTGSTNGFVAGRPTHMIQYNRTGYFVHAFNGTTPVDNVNSGDQDPGQPVLTDPVLTSVDPAQQGAGSVGERTLDFTITTQDLARNSDGSSINLETTPITGLQFNILSMDRTALSASGLGSRVMDALGNQRGASLNFNRFISLRTGNTVRDDDAINPNPEGDNDTTNGTLPPVDLVDYSIQVSIE